MTNPRDSLGLGYCTGEQSARWPVKRNVLLEAGHVPLKGFSIHQTLAPVLKFTSESDQTYFELVVEAWVKPLDWWSLVLMNMKLMFRALRYWSNIKQIIFCLKSLLLHQVQLEKELGVKTESLPREKWDTWDPTLISEVQEYRCKYIYTYKWTQKQKSRLPFDPILFSYWYSLLWAHSKTETESVCGGKYLIESANVQTTSTFQNLFAIYSSKHFLPPQALQGWILFEIWNSSSEYFRVCLRRQIFSPRSSLSIFSLWTRTWDHFRWD